ncbi:MAG: peptide antibiotic transporter SbmA [Rhizobiaceae bacterium]
MFHSFFPRPKLFILSFMAWCVVTMGLWYNGAKLWGGLIGLPPMEGAEEVGTVYYFFTPDMLWFYVYYVLAIIPFALFWFYFAPHRWQRWSILGTSFILFTTAFSVQTSVALNNWRGVFFDMVQQALTGDTKGTVPAADIFKGLFDFISIAFVYIGVLVVTRFIVSHYIFRWRTAMNEFYTENWSKLRHVEGASQRVQEDTMRFAETVEDLGVSALDAVLTLIAFLPILYRLGAQVTSLPFVGEVPQPLVVAAIIWSVFGTILLAVVGIKLPGLYFNNQKVEAAYRKELVYGEDDTQRARPPTLYQLYEGVRRNYFRLYFHYAYFNVARYFYLQTDSVIAVVLLVPTIAAGAITFGFFQQTLSAFNQVTNSFQYLVNSWGTIVELLSIHKRLKQFEMAIDGIPVPASGSQDLADMGTIAASVESGKEEVKPLAE